MGRHPTQRGCRLKRAVCYAVNELVFKSNSFDDIMRWFEPSVVGPLHTPYIPRHVVALTQAGP